MRKWTTWLMTNDPNNPHAEMIITALSLEQAKKEYSRRNGNCPLDSIQVTVKWENTGKRFEKLWNERESFRQDIRDILKERGETEEELWRWLGIKR